MSSQVPGMYWYLFWVAVLVWCIVFALFVATMTHRRNMKALEILKTYADKGVEPPASIAEQLTRQMLDSNSGTAAKHRDRGELLRSFIGFLFTACAIGGLHYWLLDAGGPSWALHASKAAMAFFGFGAFGLLIAALVVREK
jgi:hypothetical protein